MKITNLKFFKSRSDLRKWFQKNYDKKTELWIGFYNAKSGKKAATYWEALDEALCFGWIDGTRKSIDSERYTNRFSPRRPESYWSDVNIKKMKGLIKQRKVHPAGLKAFNARDKQKTKEYSFEEPKRELGGSIKKEFQKNKKAWGFFEAQPPFYKKIFSHWVNSAKKEETRSKRLALLIRASAKKKRLDMLAPNKAA